MEITLKKKNVDDGEDVLPQEDAEEAVEPKKVDRTRELELELAEKRGELKALKKSASPEPMSLEQTKQLVYGDMNNMTDDDFQKKYKMSKHAASMTVMDADNKQTKAEAKQLRAESEAISELSATFGSDFYKFKGQILENVGDLSDAARQDPERLKSWMKNQYIALSKDEPRTAKKNDERRKVVQDFEKPTVSASDKSSEASGMDDEIKDEIPADSDISNQKLASLMGVRSEKERKALSEKNLIYVDMNLGDGWSFGDPKRGFVKKERQVA